MDSNRLALVFPGQGSQSLGMLGELAQAYPQVRTVFSEASEILGRDLWQLAQAGPAEELNRTENTQPLMLAAGVAVYRVWREAGGADPAFMAGHSLGEYTALVCAESLTLPQAVSLVAQRARFMQEAVPEGQGAMAALLGLKDDQVRDLCADAAQGQVLEAVNYNAPGQVVIAGTAEAVERAVAAAKGAGARRAVKLPVSVPSHCALMKPAAERLAARLAEARVMPPRLPVLHNADVASYDSAEAIRDALARQLYSPVRWVETVQRLEADGVGLLLECGPGKVLAGLNKRIARAMQALPVFDPASLEAAIAAAGGE